MLEEFIKSADQANIQLNSIDKIRNTIVECQKWNEKFEQMQQGQHYPFLSSYEQLYEQARHFHIDLEPLKQIEQTIFQARSWLEKSQAMFRRQDSNLTLIEVNLIDFIAPSKKCFSSLVLDDHTSNQCCPKIFHQKTSSHKTQCTSRRSNQ